jgi:hypothetical protein
MTTYAWNIDNKSQPPSDWIPVVPNDSADITSTAANGQVITGVRAIRAQSAGDIRVKMSSGADRTWQMAAGETRTGFVLRVYDTGTTVDIDTDGLGLEGAV